MTMCEAVNVPLSMSGCVIAVGIFAADNSSQGEMGDCWSDLSSEGT